MPREWDGIISKQINRRLSRPVARFLADHTRISPNQVTLSSFLVAVISGLAFYFSQPLFGGVLAQLCSILDGVDGDLAVLTNKASGFGGFLDSVLDRYGDITIIAGMSYHVLTVDRQNIVGTVIGFTAMAGSVLVSYSRARAKSDLGIVFDKGFAGYAGNRDMRLFLVMFGGILNQIFITLLLLAILTNLTVLMRIYITRKIARGKTRE